MGLPALLSNTGTSALETSQAITRALLWWVWYGLR